MGTLAAILMFGLLALWDGFVQSVVVPVVDLQEVVHPSPLTTATTVTTTSKSIPVTLSESIRPLSTLATIQHHSHTLRTTATASKSLSTHPTRTGKDTTRPAGSHSTVNSPDMTTIPDQINDSAQDLDWELPDLGYQVSFIQFQEDDDPELSPRDEGDGYGYGYGSPTPTIDGGYGNPPVPSIPTLPPGGYGRPPRPDIVTVSEPATVTISLKHQTTSPEIHSIPSQVPPGIVITGHLTGTPVPQVPAHNTTCTSSGVVVHTTPTPAHHTVTPQVLTMTTPTTDGFVYTTVTSSSRTGSSTHSVTYTPTSFLPPKPVTNKNAADPNSKLNRTLLFVAAALVTMGPHTASLVGGLGLLMESNNAEAKRAVEADKKNEIGSGGNSAGEGTDVKTGNDLGHQHVLSELAKCGRSDSRVFKDARLAELEPKREAEKPTGTLSISGSREDL
ncbi:hypothetical protein M426DRAFT_258509 [Hypoxylon sp. CI-4A]|nr:hypothetical protein M426DRAFT_258509 [Hypoxylon sp. CI-4A]